MEEKNSMTIADVAKALGVSKTTVSRAISGKGRIGKETNKNKAETRCKTSTSSPFSFG